MCIKDIICISSETVGSSRPKFSEDVSLKGLIREELKTVTMVCPAQSYPLPSFRCVIFLLIQVVSCLHKQSYSVFEGYYVHL